MKYFIDTEFIEGKQDKTFLGIKYGETKPTIDLISIGIVSEEIILNQGNKQITIEEAANINKTKEWYKKQEQKEYYAISKDFNLKAAWKNEWVRENVLGQIYIELLQMGGICGDERNYWSFTQKNLKKLLQWYGKTNKQIAQEIKDFVGNGKNSMQYPTNEFYGYYSDYDWVVFCQLFGTMMELPSGFPMYCNDLKQELDRLQKIENKKLPNNCNPMLNGQSIADIKLYDEYPKQTNEHNALADAKWNYELYKFLNTI